MHPDHLEYYAFTPLSRLDKSLKTLTGIVEGIAIDSLINLKELAYLSMGMKIVPFSGNEKCTTPAQLRVSVNAAGVAGAVLNSFFDKVCFLSR